MKKSYVLILVLTFAVGFLLRFYALGEIPNGMYQDETAIGYNAYSILKTGRDEYGETFPVYFKSFGDYKLPVYIYTTVLSVAVFGLTNFAVRFPSAFFGFATLLLFFPFMRLVTKSERVALVATVLLAVTPWHLHYNRATFEVSISLFLYILGSYLLLRGIREKKDLYFVIGTLLFVLNIYTYNLTRLLSPLLYTIIVLLERSHLKNYPREVLWITCVLVAVVALPFVLTLFAPGGVASAGGTLVWSSATIQAQLLEFRSYIIMLPSLLQKILFNIPFLTFWQYCNNIVSYLSVSFFFISGSTHGNHGIGNVGEFYLFELPLFLFGLFVSLKRRGQGATFFLATGFVSIAVASLTRESPQATRSFLLIPTFLYFIAEGVIAFLVFLHTLKNPILLKGLQLACASLIIFNLAYYFASYYIRFPVAYAPMWKSEDKKLAAFLVSHEHEYESIIVDSHSGLVYTSLLYYMGYSPRVFQKTVKRSPDDSEGFSKVLSYGKFIFKDVDWLKDTSRSHTLIITSKDQDPGNLPIPAAFSYPQRPVVLAIGQKIMEFPVSDPAYVVIETR